MERECLAGTSTFILQAEGDPMLEPKTLLILGCWYFRRRSGYKMIRSPRLESPSRFSGGQFGEGGATTENKMGLAELRPVLPNAPPAYEKISIGSLPPPYSP
ncbi:melanoma antigen recognized by T-cells 1 isoform X1 [Esox lucius]|uniref:melanoma antigen recognized by T-cells 1 isoform X1 n=1 Tax=Esox lucius TaxID=8010 RepID=UPI0014775CCB|nr:melanoma antigen recognized by T-cells 1 isoform X1 [Esox lucius]